MNLVAVQGLGSLGQTPVVGESNTCMANEQYHALVASNTNAVAMWNDAKAQRWTFLFGGLVVGIAAAYVLWRNR